MFRAIAYLFAWLTDKLCYDLVNNRNERLEELKKLLPNPENYEDRLREFEIRTTIISIFETTKSSRLIFEVTCIILVLTIILLFR